MTTRASHLRLAAAVAVVARIIAASFEGQRARAATEANGKIAYSHSDYPGGPPRVYTMDPDGTDQAPLSTVSPLSWSTEPAWSADGKSIALAGALPGGAEGIFIVDVATGTLTYVTAGNDPTWSPDGRKLAFEKERQIWGW